MHNIHRGETWSETLLSLQHHTLAVRQKVCPDKPFAIGLRLSQRAAVELADPQTLLNFQRWLENNSCYVFTINGFPYGQFHGTRVKENVYLRCSSGRRQSWPWITPQQDGVPQPHRIDSSLSSNST